MKRLFLAALILIVILSTMAVLAFEPTTPAENDPATNFDANACFIGGSWFGTCGDSDLLWNAGWYLIRFEHALITRDQVPDQFKWILPKQAVATEEPVVKPSKPL